MPVRQLRLLTWGLVPSWAKDPSVGSRMANARSETVLDKPAFARAASRRRCLVPVTGWYEWQASPVARDARGRPRKQDRRVLNGIFFILRTGASWRDLPERYGPYTTVYNRFNRWAKRGVWGGIFAALAERSPDSLRMIDSTIVRAHQHAAAPKKTATRRSAVRAAA